MLVKKNHTVLPVRLMAVIGIIIIGVVFTLIASASSFSEQLSASEQEAWETSRRIVSEIEAQKEQDIRTQQSISEDERNTLLQTEKDLELAEFEQAKIAAYARYQEIQSNIADLSAIRAERTLTEDEIIELIHLQDVALDLAQRYELFRTITPEERLQNVIDTLAIGGSFLQYHRDLLASSDSDSEMRSYQYEIFLAESYMALADEVQKQRDEGISVDALMSYIDIRRTEILAEAMELRFRKD